MDRCLGWRAHRPPLPPDRARIRQVEGSWIARKTDLDFLIPFPRGIGLERQDLASAIDDRELVDEALEFRDEVRGHEYGAPFRGTVLVGTDHRLNELSAHDRIQPGRRLVEDEQVRLGAHGGDERELCPLPFRQGARLLPAVELKLRQQCRFGLAVPSLNL